MPKSKTQKVMSIRLLIVVVFIVMTIIITTLISSLIFFNWKTSTQDSIKAVADALNTQINEQVDTFLDVPFHINEVNGRLIENQVVDLENEKERQKFFVSVLSAQPQGLYSFTYGNQEGEYFGARRNTQGEIEIVVNDAATQGHSWYYSVNEDFTAGRLVVQSGVFDPRTRDWYKAAYQSGQPTFSPIYKHFIMPDLTVSAAWPIHAQDGQIVGVLGTHIILSDINALLMDIVQTSQGFALIVEDRTGAFVANSLDIENFKLLEDNKLDRTKIDDIQNLTIKGAYAHYVTTQETSFSQQAEGESFYMNFEKYKAVGVDWLVITAVPETALFSEISGSINSTTAGIIILVLLYLALYLAFTRKLVAPVGGLIAAAEKISAGDLNQRVAIVRNDELGQISVSFNKMADTIYDMIKNLEATVQERTIKLKTVNESLNANKEELQLILDSAAEGIYGVDKEGRCTFCNARAIDLLGYEKQEDFLGKSMHDQIHHSYPDGSKMPKEVCRIYHALQAQTRAHAIDEVFWRADGTSIDVEYYSYPQFKNGEFVGAVVTFMDVSDRRKDENEIKYLSCHDPLTGLKNRRCLEDSLKLLDVTENLPISILFADLNALKMSNDIFGHSSGDELIRRTAEVLQNSAREGDVVARIGGDEFLIVLPKTDGQEAFKIKMSIMDEISKVRIQSIQASLAVGYDTKIVASTSIEDTMTNAEDFMYQEKSMQRKDMNVNTVHTIIESLHKLSPREKEHSQNVSKLSRKLGLALKLPEAQVKRLEEAAYLHDIGKIAFSESVLKGEDNISAKDEAMIRQHSVAGYRILNLFDDTLDLADGVYGHHENWDGSGYPKGLKAEEIPESARIIAIAEAYDAMTTPYGAMLLTKEQAVKEINSLSGKRFDPAIVEVFCDIMKTETP